MQILIIWVSLFVIGHLVSKWVDRNNREERKRLAQKSKKENYIYYLNKEKRNEKHYN